MEQLHRNLDHAGSQQPIVELVYWHGCPHVDVARTMMRAALELVGAEDRWTEWDREDPATPSELRGYGSPTVLVNRKSVSGGASLSPDGSSCSLYVDDQGLVSGAPSASQIAKAIQDAAAPTSGCCPP